MPLFASATTLWPSSLSCETALANIAIELPLALSARKFISLTMLDQSTVQGPKEGSDQSVEPLVSEILEHTHGIWRTNKTSYGEFYFNSNAGREIILFVPRLIQDETKSQLESVFSATTYDHLNLITTNIKSEAGQVKFEDYRMANRGNRFIRSVNLGLLKSELEAKILNILCENNIIQGNGEAIKDVGDDPSFIAAKKILSEIEMNFESEAKDAGDFDLVQQQIARAFSRQVKQATEMKNHVLAASLSKSATQSQDFAGRLYGFSKVLSIGLGGNKRLEKSHQVQVGRIITELLESQSVRN